MEEVWKDVKGYEGLYQVSSLGRVKSCDRVTVFKDGRQREFYGKILKELNHNAGYLQVALSRNGVVNKYLIHVLVARAFLPNRSNLSEVGHKDETKTNNTVSNLEWVTHSYNCNMPIYKKRKSEAQKGKLASEETKNKISKLTKRGNNPRAKKVLCENKIFQCAHDCGDYYNIKSGTLRSWLRGDRTMPEKFKKMGLCFI